MSEQQPLSHKDAIEQALNAKAEPAWDPIYKEGQEFRLDQISGMPGVGLEVFPDHEVVRVTTRNMTALTFPTRAVPHIKDGAVVFTNREGRLTLHANGEVLWERVPDTTDAPARQEAVRGSTSDLHRHPSGPQKASEAVVPAQQDVSKPGRDGQTPRTSTAETKEERVELTGRVGRTPTFHTTAKGTLIASFPVAVHLEDGSTTWHKIAAFKDKARKLQEQVAQGQVVTGKEVAVVGYVHYREKQSKNGKTRRVREIWAAGPVRPR